VDQGYLHRLFIGQWRQDPGKPSRQHGLASSRGAVEKNVMPAGGSDLNGTAGEKLPADFGEVNGGGGFSQGNRFDRGPPGEP
jgi:hypothetical protein